jgi:hypothetical protein
MSTAQAGERCLAEFAKSVDEGAGRFRAPKTPNSSKGVHVMFNPDGIMPQLGTYFFLKNPPHVGHASPMRCYEMKEKMSVCILTRSDGILEQNSTSWERSGLGPVSAVTHCIKIATR